MSLWKPIAVAASVALGVAALGTAATDLGPWYQDLIKPSWQPPGWLFGPAWTVIYALAATAAVLAYRGAPGVPERRRIVLYFGVNALLNVLWSELFFGLHRPDWAMLEVVLLWLSVAFLFIVLRPFSRAASWLMVPYLAWVTFASALNLAIVILNGPFAGGG